VVSRLRGRQLLGAIEQRRAQLMQPGERRLHLRLHAHHPQEPAPSSRPVRPGDPSTP
jgi:hypothetical protein